MFAILALFQIASPALSLPPSECVVQDTNGTAALPPAGCSYVSLTPMAIVDGLPPGEPVLCDAVLSSFFDIFYLTGSVPGSEIQRFHAQLAFDMSGTGSNAGYFRPAFFDVFCEMESAPRPPSLFEQPFSHELGLMQGQLPIGDPDFDLLRITAGGSFGMPSPGHTTLTVAGPGGGGGGSGGWAVDSFFDITYRIDFVGHPGGPFSGRSGSTTGTIRMQCGTSDPVAIENDSFGSVKALFR